MEMKLYVLIFAIKFNYVPNSKKAIWAYHLLNIHWAFKCLSAYNPAFFVCLENP